MTVRELITLLSNEDGGRIVVMSRDAEGNGHSPLTGVFPAAYAAKTTWAGDVGLETLTDEDRERGYDEEDVAPDGAVPCLVLKP